MQTSRTRQTLRRLSMSAVMAGSVAVGAVGIGVGVGAGPASAATRTPNLSGVTVNFADIFKQYQTLIAATNSLNGAKYKVAFSDFTSGSPIIAAETGGSVDLGVTGETPTIFAQSDKDPVKVVAAIQGVGKTSPLAIMVAPGSSIKTIADLKGKTIAVQEGTVEQYALVQALQSVNVPYSDVTIDNLSVTAGEAALESGRVDAWVGVQPLVGLAVESKKAKILTNTIPGSRFLEYLVASQSALDNRKTTAAIIDFIVRLDKSEAILRKDPTLAAETYVKTYGVPLSVAKEAVASTKVASIPISASLIKYQQTEANTFLKLDLLPAKINVAKIFDIPLNKTILAAVGLSAK